MIVSLMQVAKIASLCYLTLLWCCQSQTFAKVVDAKSPSTNSSPLAKIAQKAIAEPGQHAPRRASRPRSGGACFPLLFPRQKKRERQKQRGRETERQRDRETERQRDRETERQRERDRETERQRDRETERQRDRETERQRGRRERERHRETPRGVA